MNTCDVVSDGPFCLRGALALKQGEGMAQEAQLKLCRCGGSRNKPFCDDTHRVNGFADTCAFRAAKAPPAGTDLAEPLRIRPSTDGPLQCTGPLMLRDAAGVTVFMEAGYLCRCGRSQNKPFCDGMHRRIGFVA